MAELELPSPEGDLLGYLNVTDGQVPILRFVGEFDLSNVDVLTDCLAAWVLQGRTEAVIDLTETAFIDSTTIGALVAAQLAGLLLTVRGASGSVQRALEVAGIARLLNADV